MREDILRHIVDLVRKLIQEEIDAGIVDPSNDKEMMEAKNRAVNLVKTVIRLGDENV